MRFPAAILTLASLLTVAGSAANPKFYSDDPIWTERDSQDASGVQAWEIDLFVDLTYNLFGRPGDPTPGVRAKNLNTVDQVPDSSWFTNRAGRRALTPSEVMGGPDTTQGPAPGTWTITSSKSDGVTPGFTIRDSTGQLWFLKFDPPGYRGMATGTEVVVTKLLWALGYHVPENHIAALRPDQLTIGDGARFTPPGAQPRPMRTSDITDLLKRADRDPDGTYRVVASKALEGTPLGGFRFYGTRPDDPNDIVPHEHRRELRGYGVFAAWLNHVDAKAINSLDTLVRQNGRAVVRHHLIDFGSALGSASIAPREYWEGFESLVEPAASARQMVAFGFSYPKWHTLDFYSSPSIGRLPLDNTQFDPERWEPRVPNPAFLRARADDRFWAAEKLVTLTDELVRAAVQTGDFRDPKSEGFLVKALCDRRDAIVSTYLTTVNPISDPVLDAAGAASFRNLAVEAGVAPAPTSYRANWFAFDNTTGETRPLGESSGSTTQLRAPVTLSGAFVKVELAAAGGPNSTWERPVTAYFRRSDAEWRLVGFERQSEH